MTESNGIWEYSQPDFYHFSDDSVWLVKKVFEIIPELNINMRILDICSGSGVVGMEFAALCKNKLNIDFLELQHDFNNHYNKNLLKMGERGEKFNFINKDFRFLLRNKEYQNRYDLIISNPPFFNVNDSRLSKDHKRNICRFFIEGSFQEFYETLQWLLKSNGKIFFLCRKFYLAHINNCINNNHRINIVAKKADTLLINLSF